ncbi:hypothetical protein AAG570_003358 [Ranatra chinensis]|uniref:Uncharacterized protein n=1 Tax=Ranatra chinensis TaxID=642074 RepID=A0ABD0Y3H8_9HEMI
MASKRRNMFHKNKTQETTEKGVVFAGDSPDCPGQVVRQYTLRRGLEQPTGHSREPRAAQKAELGRLQSGQILNQNQTRSQQYGQYLAFIYEGYTGIKVTRKWLHRITGNVPLSFEIDILLLIHCYHFQTFPNDQKKMEEERALSSSTDHKDMPTAADPLPSNHEPRSVYRTTGEFGGSSSVEDGSSTPRRRVERYPPAPGTRMTTPSTTTVASSSGSLRTSIPPRSTHYSKPPTSAQLSFTDREFLVDTGVRLLREVNAGNTKVFREPVYARQTVTRTKTTKQSEDSKGSTGRTTPNRKPQQQSSFPIPAPKNAPQGIPVPRTPRGNRSGPTTPPGANRRLGGNLPPSHQKRHSLEVMDLNSNGENSRPDKTEAEGKSETVTNDNDNSGSGMGDNNNGRQGLTGGAARRQSHLPRPLSCINFPVKPLEGIKPVNQRLSSRLPVSR